MHLHLSVLVPLSDVFQEGRRLLLRCTFGGLRRVSSLALKLSFSGLEENKALAFGCSIPFFILAPPKLASLPIAAALWSKPCKCATGKRTAAISALLPKYRLWYALSWFPVSPIDLLQLMCHTPTEEIVRGAVHYPDSMGVRDPTNCGAAQICLDRGNWRDLARAFYPPGGFPVAGRTCSR